MDSLKKQEHKILHQIAADFIEGACIPCVETIIYYDKGYLPLHITESLKLIQQNFKYSDN